MTASITWFIVLLAGAMALIYAIELAGERSPLLTRFGSLTGRVMVAVLSAVLLILLALIWRINAVAAADGRLVNELAHLRNPNVTAYMKIVTTMGDALPSLIIATTLTIIIYRQGQYRVLAVLPPVAILVELAIQIGMSKVFHDVTVHDVASQLVIGGTGTIPSGSVARLYSAFLIASHLWHPKGRTGAARVATLGGILVLIQLATRIYLARHLVADIAGGLFLGVFLERIGAAITMWRSTGSSVGAPMEQPVSAQATQPPQ